jgi:tetratricopeptide (TPR) repeat protein
VVVRRDLDRLAWGWMVLGGVAALLHLVLAVLLIRSGVIGLLVPTPDLLPDGTAVYGVWWDLVLALVWASIVAATVMPSLVAFTLGIGLLERRWWALPLALVALLPAVGSVPPLGLAIAVLTAWTLWSPAMRARLSAQGDDALAWRLGAVMNLHDRPVGEGSGESGPVSVVGLAPDLQPRIAWARRDRFAVVDGESERIVDPEHPALLTRGEATVAVSVVPELRVRRWIGWSIAGSMWWLGVVTGASVLADQGKIAWDVTHCAIFGVGCPDQGDKGTTAAYTAEYLARLLREDYQGEDRGVMDPDMERPDATRKVTEEKHFYIPAGNKGPVTRMGGAADVAAEPIRSPQSEEDALPIPKKKRPAKTVAVADDASQVKPQPTEADDDGAADAAQDSPLDDPKDDHEKPAPPAEEKEGWGVQDWYDEQDRRLDDQEIKLMIKLSKDRLRIDPLDPTALSVLSYYQYLAEDYDAAESTYDKYISVLPEDAAGYNNKALIYKRRGDYVKEEGLYRVALAFEPDDETALNNLGVNLAHQKRFPEALAVMKRLEDLDPGDPYADLHRAKIYAEMGDDATSLSYLEKALQGMADLDTLHHIEFRQDIRLDPSFAHLRETERFRSILLRYYGKDSPLQEP